MSQPNETQLTEAPAPWAPKPRDRRALSAYRHGLTGQIHLLTDTDRAAYRDYVAAREAARLEKIKSLRHPVQPWPAPVVGANGDRRAPPRTA